MTILVLANSLPPSGGAEKVAWDLSNIYSLKHKVHIFVFSDRFYVDTFKNIKIHHFKIHKNSLRYYLSLGKKLILKKANDINPDLIHAHSATIFAFLLRKSKSKKILTLHNSEFFNYNYSFFKKLKLNFIFCSCVNNYDIKTTVSLKMQKYFTNYFNKEFHFIPNGIDDSIFFFKKKKKKEVDNFCRSKY